MKNTIRSTFLGGVGKFRTMQLAFALKKQTYVSDLCDDLVIFYKIIFDFMHEFTSFVKEISASCYVL